MQAVPELAPQRKKEKSPKKVKQAIAKKTFFWLNAFQEKNIFIRPIKAF
jgi:hypothetical protein